MSTYAKLVNKQLELLPSEYIYTVSEGYTVPIIPYPEKQAIKDGYKTVVYAEHPQEVTGITYSEYYTEDDNCIYEHWQEQRNIEVARSVKLEQCREYIQKVITDCIQELYGISIEIKLDTAQSQNEVNTIILDAGLDINDYSELCQDILITVNREGTEYKDILNSLKTVEEVNAYDPSSKAFYSIFT